MARGYQQPQGTTGQGQTGQTSGMQHGQGGGMQHGGGQTGGTAEMGLRLSEVESPEQRMAAEDIAEAIQVCGWCADQCIREADPGMVECIRLCEDVTELGETALALLPRNSQQAPAVLQAFEQAARACAAECSQHHHAHCQECAEVLGLATESVGQLLASLGGGMQGGSGGTSRPATSW